MVHMVGGERERDRHIYRECLWYSGLQNSFHIYTTCTAVGVGCSSVVTHCVVSNLFEVNRGVGRISRRGFL